MKFQLSTLLLTLALIATACGWLVDRVRSNAEQQRIVDGAIFLTNPVAVESIASVYYQNSTIFDSEIEKRMVMEIRRIAINQDQIIAYRDKMFGDYNADNNIDSSRSPAILAKRLIDLLGCTSVEQYMLKFKSIYSKERFPEYYINDSPEAIQLRLLLEGALTNSP